MILRFKMIVAAIAICTPALAQSYTAPKFNYSYGYQPYDDRSPKGFNHPANMGFGTYVYDPPVKGRRVKGLSYRRFKGY